MNRQASSPEISKLESHLGTGCLRFKKRVSALGSQNDPICLNLTHWRQKIVCPYEFLFTIKKENLEIGKCSCIRSDIQLTNALTSLSRFARIEVNRIQVDARD